MKTSGQGLFEELLAKGRELAPDERLSCLRSLARLPHFPVLLAIVREDWEDYARSFSSQKMAEHRGCLEHCAGSLHAMEVLEGKLRAALEAPKATTQG
jgi:hypothetical protein